MNVDQKRDLLKRYKGYAQRQNYVLQDKVRCKYIIDRSRYEVEVLEIAQKRDIECNTREEHGSCGDAPVFGLAQSQEGPSQNKVDQDRRCDQQEIKGPPPSVKEE